jgi:hypothetical protein
MGNYRYILRYYIDPAFHAEERIRELVEFCLSARVDEVMLFDFPEELYPGYPAPDEVEDWLCLAEKVKAELSKIQVDFSINPWATTVHLSRGRKFASWQRDWQPMVGETGTVSSITSCPLCKKWQEYLCNYFQLIADRLQPLAIWVEDDWRLHNHGVELGFGGCYCEEHLRRFSDKAGQSVSRHELLAAILDKAQVHPWRRLWLDLCRDTILEATAAVRGKCTVPLALMSSIPDVHSTEGRDWRKLKEALAGEGKLMLRPHLPPYTEVRPFQITPGWTRQTIASLPDSIIYPEMESSPRCGRYSKSGAFVKWACLHSVCYGAKGMTFNHFDVMGNGVSADPTFAATLAGIKEELNYVARLDLNDAESEGIDILYSPDVANYAQSKHDKSMSGLVADSHLWSDTFYALGISHQFKSTVGEKRIIAVNGETIRGFDNSELEKLLSNMVFLDAEATRILVERGLGRYLGINIGNYGHLEERGFSYEVINETSERMTAQRCTWNLLEMNGAEAEELTAIHRFDRARISSGMTCYKNSLGGDVICIAYPLGTNQFFMGFFNEFRRKLYQRLILKLRPDYPILMADDLLHCYRVKCQQKTFIGLINSTFDSIRHPRLNIDAEIDEIASMNAKFITIEG